MKNTLKINDKKPEASAFDLSDHLSAAGLKAFFASPYIKGIGEVFADKLVSKFGFDLLNPDFDFDRVVGAVPGLTEIKINDIKESFQKIKFDPTVAVFLYSAGLKDIEVEKILSHYGKKAAKALSEDPYDMVENAWKVSFFTADKLGRWLGIAPDDPRRIRGALLTAVKFYAERGNMFATESQTLKTASSLTGAPENLVSDQLDSLLDDGRLVRSGEGIYLPVYYEAEKIASEKICQLIKKNHRISEDYEIPTSDINGNPLNKNQIEALRTVMNNPVTVITGGPGTGKTTTVKGLIDMFEGMGKKTILAAPTGRAAKRMADLSGGESKTLHRLLGYNRGRGYRNKHLDADILVIDEASMLEQVMFRHVLDALDHNTKVVLVGDTNQLPSIGAGDVLNDIMASGVIPVIRLNENFRHRDGSAIAEVAEDIKAGRGLLKNAEKDFRIIFESNQRQILEKVRSLVGSEIPEEFGIDPKNIQVVSPQQDGPLGARQLNLDIQQAVNPSGPEIKRGMKLFRLGDRVMQTSNSSEYDVYNGETGWISDVDLTNQRVLVSFFDGKKIWYDKTRFKELSLAYATTVHKLQGSETDYMVFILSSHHRQLLYRNLLYTGISRARKLCVLIGEEKAINAALNNDSPSVRNSNFKHRLRKNLGA